MDAVSDSTPLTGLPESFSLNSGPMTSSATESPTTKRPVTWSRLDVAHCLDQAHQLGACGSCESEIASCLGVPESTLRAWLKQHQELRRNPTWSPRVVDFFESPSGQCCLHRVLSAVHLVFGQANDAGIRNICSFLELSGLSTFVAASYGAQQRVAENMESLLIEFARQEEPGLAAQMSPRQITLCEDETFHPQICLVAIEPVSNFILLEQYQPARDAETWNRCLDERLAGLPITVCQVTSDLAKALVAHAEVHLGAHHSPDLFHVQYDTVRATSFPLASQTRRAQEQLSATEVQIVATRQELEACRQQCPEDSHGWALQRQLEQAQAARATAQQRLSDCEQRQERATQARQGLGRDYHPLDLTTGQPLSADEVQQRLAAHFDTLDQVAIEAGLSAHAREKLHKARRVLPLMQASLAFFWIMITQRLNSRNLSAAVQDWMREQLIPAYYVARVAEKAETAVERHRLRKTADQLFARARSPDGVYGTLSPEVQAELEQQASDDADLFQRSSSCVEGRNGQLSLTHHGLHRLSSRKMQALTVLHNYLIRRADGTTAAERFYGSRPRDLFPWLLDRLMHPARPRPRCRAA